MEVKNTLSEKKSAKKQIPKVNNNDFNEIYKESTPIDIIIQKIEETCPSDSSLQSILNKTFQSHRSMSEKIELTRAILNNAEKTSSILTPEDNNSRKSNNFNFLSIVSLGDLQLLDEVLKHKLNINFRDSNKRNALFYAINADKGDNSDIISRLISEGISINECDTEDGHSPLTLASMMNLKDTVRILLYNKADINHYEKKMNNTCLHYSVINNSIELVSIIMQYNPNLTIKNKEGKTAVDLSFGLGFVEINQVLKGKFLSIEEKAKLNVMEIYDDEKKKEESKELQMLINNENDDFSDDKISRTESKNTGEITLNGYLLKSNSNEDINTQKIIQEFRMDLNLNNSKNFGFEQKNIISFEQRGNNITKNNIYESPKNKNESIENKINNKINDTHKNRDYFSYKIGNNSEFIKQSKISNSNVYINVPFNFVSDPSNIKKNGGKFLNDFLNMESPSMTIDLSDENKYKEFLNMNTIDEYHESLNEMNNLIKKLENENKILKGELSKLKEDMINKDNKILQLSNELRSKDDGYKKHLIEIQNIIDEKNKQNSALIERIENSEKEINEFKSREKSKISIRISNEETNKTLYLEKKFLTIKYDDKFASRCLGKDLIDFSLFIKEQIKKGKLLFDEILKLVQEAVNEVSTDFEVKLYGSHATNLCLPWSDIDLVIIPKSPINFNSLLFFLRKLSYVFYNDKKWTKSVKLIESAMIPIIKIVSNDQYGSIQIDISIQDPKHYGLKCVDLVKNFLRDFPVLEPLILTLKNILKYANLNDPYTGGLSSYGLILIVVSFLQLRIENNQSINISDIGAIFLDFLYYYGYKFDHTKSVVFAGASDSTQDKESLNSYLMNNQNMRELMVIDPLNKINNVAKSTFEYSKIKMAYIIAFVVSHEDCECGCHYQYNEEIINSLQEHCILKRIFLAVKRFNS